MAAFERVFDLFTPACEVSEVASVRSVESPAPAGPHGRVSSPNREETPTEGSSSPNERGSPPRVPPPWGREEKKLHPILLLPLVPPPWG
eukprot:scaffold360_cov374-Pavlova_lutheri.AAC.88